MGATANGIKSGWRCCDRCNGLYLDGGGGSCVGGNSHTTAVNGGGGVSEGTVPGWQSNWRLCKKCGSLFYYGNPTNGVCFKGGAHDYENTKGYSLEMRTTKAATGFPPYFTMWRWCHNCESFFYGGASKMGSCPKGGSHDASKSNYYSIHYFY
ncbi:MAG TPA: hypothetical protein VJ781_02870 [Pyrinomonadaceae bacterium]|jgi:hypothetical protein|nr:hypothetical protein [Pyrinomonadaceae bacterium]